MINLEPELLNQARQGNSEAFSRLVEIYQNPVYNLCYRMLGDPFEAEDAAQETFVRAYSNLSRFNQQRSFSTWILSIAAHYCIDQLRKRRMMLVSLDEGEDLSLNPPDSSPSPEAIFSIREHQVRIRKLLDTLQPQDRAAVIMHYWYDLSYEEIGQALSMTVSALKSRLHRARLTLAQSWIDQEKGEVVVERRKHDKVGSPVF